MKTQKASSQTETEPILQLPNLSEAESVKQ